MKQSLRFFRTLQNSGGVIQALGKRLLLLPVVGLLLLAGEALQAQEGDSYGRASSGTRELTLGSGTHIKLLLEAANLGSGEIEVGEITFPVGLSPQRGHRHGALEIFYIVEGVLDHVVNGEPHRLEPGMLGIVKAGDEVIHRVLSDTPVRALVIWVPGGEAGRIAPLERWSPIGNRLPEDATVRR